LQNFLGTKQGPRRRLQKIQTEREKPKRRRKAQPEVFRVQLDCVIDWLGEGLRTGEESRGENTEKKKRK
jgi:hypothetical protein